MSATYEFHCPRCSAERIAPMRLIGRRVRCPACDEMVIAPPQTTPQERSLKETWTDSPFDPYYKWLAIPVSEQPPNYYRLLGLPIFESDEDVIDNAAERQMAHVKNRASGRYAELSQKLLNELAGAHAVLIDPDRRFVYDNELRSSQRAGEIPLDAQQVEASQPAGKPVGTGTVSGFAPIVLEDEQDKTQIGDTHSDQNAAAPAELPQQFGRYRVIRKLGEGGMGAVYLAHDERLDREVALKVPRFDPKEGPAALERFYREARAAATISHGNICPVFDVDAISGVHYLSMAYVDGRPLSDVFATGDPVSERAAAVLVRKVANALHEAHSKGVVHRDLKPSNIMINARKEPVVMDFGLARKVGGDDIRLTKTGALMGTPAFMSPEQVAGQDDKIGPLCDVYSLGVILYELLTRRLPFEGSLGEVMAQISRDEPRPPSEFREELSPTMENICLKAMSKRPEDRFGTAADLAEALTAFLTSKEGNKPSAKRSPKLAPRPAPAADPALMEMETQALESPKNLQEHEQPVEKAPPAAAPVHPHAFPPAQQVASPPRPEAANPAEMETWDEGPEGSPVALSPADEEPAEEVVLLEESDGDETAIAPPNPAAFAPAARFKGSPGVAIPPVGEPPEPPYDGGDGDGEDGEGEEEEAEEFALDDDREPFEQEMDMTPMVDVTFLLLIFFMVTAAFSLQRSIEMPTPDESEPSTNVQQIEEVEEDPDYVTVRVDAYNTYRVVTADWESPEEAPSKQELLLQLRRAREGDSRGRKPNRLLVIADGEALHSKVVAALDAGAEVGMETVQLQIVEDAEEF